MQLVRFALVAMTTSLAAFAACAGSSPPSHAPAGAAPLPVIDGGAPHVDPGATSTTTQTLGGGAGGTKLTPLAAADAGGDARVKHRAELGRTVTDLQAIVAAHRAEARACYDAALPNHPGVEGTIDVRWTIDPSGKVTDIDIDTSHSELVEPAVANCVMAVIKKIQFNASAGGFETKTHYPFNFHPHTRHTVSTGSP